MAAHLKSLPWVYLDQRDPASPGLWCARCGAKEPTPFPIALKALWERCAAFEERHAACVEAEAGGQLALGEVSGG